MAGNSFETGESMIVLNNRPPGITEDFGIKDEEDEIDRELMPDETSSSSVKKKSSHDR